MALTIISLLIMIVIFAAGLNKGDSNLSGLYYFKADTTNFKGNITSTGGFIQPLLAKDPPLRAFINNLVSSSRSNNLADIYEIYLRNYCSGSKNSTGGAVLTTCSPAKSDFWFDPITIWGLNGTGVAADFPTALQDGLNVYQKVSKWMFVAYVVAIIATAANVVLGIFAICSRWGSCVTSIAASIATLFTFLAALTSTILFSTLTGTFNTVLSQYGIHLTVGTKMLSLDWLAFAFSLGASLFWTISICCCSGKSSHPKNGGKGGPASFASRGYAPLGEEQGKNVEMGAVGGRGPYAGRETAYEPFRHT